ncbi:MAG TPA: prolipoprotein diacylglyceryl transferase family protein [Cyclobacteriaceae bacterium]|nr:prolipoprotein diacylglyceryl transferase family protein [Cyclobacteriaceae bacterium]
MEPFIVINPDQTGIYYVIFYLLSFLVGFVLLIWEGRKRKFPALPWMLVITTVFLFFLVGVQAIKFSREDWQLVFQFKALGHDPGRSVIGGILFAIPGLIMAKYFLRFRYDVMDAFAWIAPIGMFVQRLGCFLAGCCFGKTTTAPWGAYYGISSHAFNRHVQEGLISEGSHMSMAVHPVPLYEMVCCVLMVFILFRLKKHFHASGNLLFASVGLYGVGRFVTEFYRANSIGIYNPTGLTFIQVAILFVLPFIVALILYRERKFRLNTITAQLFSIRDKHAFIYFIYFLPISFLFLLVSRWLTILEIVTLNIVMFPTLLFVGWQVFKSITVPKLRFTTICLVAGSFVMMSQTLPERSTSDSTKLSYNVFSFGLISSRNTFKLTDIDYTSTNCNGNPTSTNMNYYLENAAKVYGLGFGRVEQTKKEEVRQYGVDVYWGRNTEDLDGNEISSADVFGIHPYFQYDWQSVGTGFGFHAGNFSQTQFPDLNSTGTTISSVKKLNFFPSFYLRTGKLNRVFLEAKVAQQFPAPFPALSFQTNIGIGLKKNKGGAIRVGTGSYAGLFVAPSFPLGKDVILEFSLGGLPTLFAKVDSDPVFESIKQEENFIGSFNLRVKLGRKEKPLK